MNTGDRILKVDEKNCYPHPRGHCIHVVHVMNKNNEIESKMITSDKIYENMKKDAPVHIKERSTE